MRVQEASIYIFVILLLGVRLLVLYLEGLNFSDYAQSTIVNFTNASGHSEDYYLLRTNNTYNGASLSWGVY